MFKTQQEDFWAGEFGDNYITRNCSKELLASNLNLFSTVFGKTEDVKSVLEFGANIGMNLRAISLLKPKLEDISAVEINEKAAKVLQESKRLTDVYNQSILEFNVNKTWDFVFTKGVLIHIAPEFLPQVYEKIYNASEKYIFIAEYYNPSPLAITYRGETDKLFKRDFAGEIMDKFEDLKLLDYGFVYRNDNNYSLDDITWFLLKK